MAQPEGFWTCTGDPARRFHSNGCVKKKKKNKKKKNAWQVVSPHPASPLKNDIGAAQKKPPGPPAWRRHRLREREPRLYIPRGLGGMWRFPRNEGPRGPDLTVSLTAGRPGWIFSAGRLRGAPSLPKKITRQACSWRATIPPRPRTRIPSCCFRAALGGKEHLRFLGEMGRQYRPIPISAANAAYEQLVGP